MKKMFKFWRSVISKTPTEFTKEFAVEFEKLYKKIGLEEENYCKTGKATYRIFNSNWSPLHIAAESGKIHLCEHFMKKYYFYY